MPNPDLTRLTISWTKETDLELRSYLGSQGMKKGDLSKFIEEAVKWRVFDQTLAEVRDKFADMRPEELEAVIGEAVAAARKASVPKAG